MSRVPEWHEPSFEHRTESELPEGWSYVALGNVGAWGTGGTPSKARSDFWEGGSVPWVSPKDMKVSLIGDAQDHLTKNAVESGEAALVPPGTILFVVRGMILAHTFPVALTTREVAFNQDMRSVEPYDGVHGPYLLRVLQHEAMGILFAVKEATHGTLRLESSTLLPWPIPLPPLAEQRRIVAKVEALLAEVNASRERLAKLPAILKRFRQSVLAAACSGRLTEEWRDSHPPQVRAEALPGRTAPSTWDTPESWEWRSLASLLDPDRAAAYGVLQPGPDVEDGVPFVRVCDIHGGTVVMSGLKRIERKIAEAYPRTRLEGGELLVTLVGTIGRTALAPAALNGANVARAVGVFPLGRDVEAPFVQMSLDHPTKNMELVDISREVARKTLNLGLIREVAVPVPPLDEQREIVRRVDALFAVADKIEKHLAAAMARADKITQAVLAKAIRGELVPTEAELARQEGREYEPASVLLERIAKAQSKGETAKTQRRARRPSPPLP